MYLRGRLTLDLRGTRLQLKPPEGFFQGIANLLTQGRWQTKEEVETYKLLSFIQSVYNILAELGVKNVIRVALGEEVLYEDFQDTPNDLEIALKSLQSRLEEGMEPDPRSEFDMVLKHNDGVLTYVIDLDFLRVHKVGVPPVTVLVTAVPSELRREEMEAEEAYQERVLQYFQNQESFDSALTRWQEQFEAFIEQIRDRFLTYLGIQDVKLETRTILPHSRNREALETYARFGYPLYGFDLLTDLAYLLLWDWMWDRYRFRVYDVYYGDYGSPYIYVGDRGWGYEEVQRQPEPVLVSGGGGDLGLDQWTASSDSGGGGDVDLGGTTDISSDSGGGGWLDSIGDFFSDSGGGGDIDIGDIGGGSDSGGGGDI